MIDCTYRTAEGTCFHVDQVAGHPVKSVEAAGLNILFSEQACHYCIKERPKESQRKGSLPVRNFIAHVQRAQAKKQAGLADAPPRKSGCCGKKAPQRVERPKT